MIDAPRIRDDGVKLPEHLRRHTRPQHARHGLVAQLFRLLVHWRGGVGGVDQNVGVQQDDHDDSP